MEIATKQELPDRIRWVKFSAAAWYKDGFYYSGYDQPAPGEELKARNEYQKFSTISWVNLRKKIS